MVSAVEGLAGTEAGTTDFRGRSRCETASWVSPSAPSSGGIRGLPRSHRGDMHEGSPAVVPSGRQPGRRRPAWPPHSSEIKCNIEQISKDRSPLQDGRVQQVFTANGLANPRHGKRVGSPSSTGADPFKHASQQCRRAARVKDCVAMSGPCRPRCVCSWSHRWAPSPVDD